MQPSRSLLSPGTHFPHTHAPPSPTPRSSDTSWKPQAIYLRELAFYFFISFFFFFSEIKSWGLGNGLGVARSRLPSTWEPSPYLGSPSGWQPGGGRREKLAQLSARANEMCSPWRGACDVRKDWLKTVSAFEACSVYVSVNIHPEVKRLALDPGSSRVCASEIDRGHKFLPVTVEGEEGLISPKNNII